MEIIILLVVMVTIALNTSNTHKPREIRISLDRYDDHMDRGPNVMLIAVLICILVIVVMIPS